MEMSFAEIGPRIREIQRFTNGLADARTDSQTDGYNGMLRDGRTDGWTTGNVLPPL